MKKNKTILSLLFILYTLQIHSMENDTFKTVVHVCIGTSYLAASVFLYTAHKTDKAWMNMFKTADLETFEKWKNRFKKARIFSICASSIALSLAIPHCYQEWNINNN